MTTIQLPDEEAQAFLTFRKFQGIFQPLIDAEVQNVKRGEAVLSFDHDGNLMHIEIKRIAYRKK